MLHHAELLVLGKKGYEYSEVTWRDFLREYGLFGHGDLGIAEVTPYRAFVHKLMTPGSTSDMKTRKDLLFLRIGRYDEYGLTTNPPDQFKHNVRLPTFTPKLRTAGRKFKLAIRSIMGTITNEISDTIVKWINLPALREYYDPVLDESTVVKRKRDDNDTTNNDKQNMEQQKQISTDSSTTKPSPPADSTAKPCPPADDVVMQSTTTSNTTPAYNDKYPLLSSLNIDLMNREGNLQRLEIPNTNG